MMKKIGFFGLLIFWVLCLGITVQAAPLSPAIPVLQEDIRMVKTGVGLNSVSFGEEDFTRLLGESAFTGVAITKLPDAADGVQKLGAKDIAEGEVLTPENIRSIRPAYGMKPKYYKEVLGKSANKELKAGTPLRMQDFN